MSLEPISNTHRMILCAHLILSASASLRAITSHTVYRNLFMIRSLIMLFLGSSTVQEA